MTFEEKLDKIFEIFADEFWDLTKEEQEKYEKGFAELINSNREEFITYFRKSEYLNNADINFQIGFAIEDHYQDWQEFIIEEITRHMENAKAGNYKTAFECVDAYDLPYSDKPNDFTKTVSRLLKSYITGDDVRLSRKSMYLLPGFSLKTENDTLSFIESYLDDEDLKTRVFARHAFNELNDKEFENGVKFWDKVKLRFTSGLYDY